MEAASERNGSLSTTALLGQVSPPLSPLASLAWPPRGRRALKLLMRPRSAPLGLAAQRVFESWLVSPRRQLALSGAALPPDAA